MTTGSFMQALEEKSPTLTARDYKDAPIVNRANPTPPPGYIVRRLTPRECLILMNLPSGWCDDISIDEPTEADYIFWESVFSSLGKKKSRKQIASWLKKPYQCRVIAASTDWIPIDASGHFDHHSRICAVSVVASLNPFCVKGVLSSLQGNTGFPYFAYRRASRRTSPS